MKLQLSILLLTCGTLFSYPDPLINRLDLILEQVNLLTGYGPLKEPSQSSYDLEGYRKLVMFYLEQELLVPESFLRLTVIAERIFSQKAYRDGSQRSRILQNVQQTLIDDLIHTERGRALLSLIAKKSPLSAEQIRLLTT